MGDLKTSGRIKFLMGVVRASHSSLFLQQERVALCHKAMSTERALEDSSLLELSAKSTEQRSYGALVETRLNSSQQGNVTDQDQLVQAEEHDYAVVEFPTDMNDTTGKQLEKCQKLVLRPYNTFLCVIGWRRVLAYEGVWYIIFSFWPAIVLLLLVTSCTVQILLCYTRDSIPLIHGDDMYIKCSDHIASSFIMLDILLVMTYLYGLFIFRIRQHEDLSGLTEKVFCTIEEKESKKLSASMLFFLMLGILWIGYSIGVSIMRIFVHGLNKEVELEFLKKYGNDSTEIKIAMLTTAQIGFIVIDVAYASVVVNYAMQCQLIVYSINNIGGRIRTKATTIDRIIKEVCDVKVCLSKINGHLSRATGAIMFIFLYSSVSSLYSLQQLKPDDDDLVLAAITGFLSSIQWTVWLVIPLIQAARVTHAGTQLKEKAMEIRSRPFLYMNAPQIELDSLIIYCSNVHLKAKLLSIPISPSLVVGGAFFLGFTIYMVLKFDNYSWASWL